LAKRYIQLSFSFGLAFVWLIFSFVSTLAPFHLYLQHNFIFKAKLSQSSSKPKIILPQDLLSQS